MLHILQHSNYTYSHNNNNLLILHTYIVFWRSPTLLTFRKSAALWTFAEKYSDTALNHSGFTKIISIFRSVFSTFQNGINCWWTRESSLSGLFNALIRLWKAFVFQTHENECCWLNIVKWFVVTWYAINRFFFFFCILMWSLNWHFYDFD